jgi:hypothetical protein
MFRTKSGSLSPVVSITAVYVVLLCSGFARAQETIEVLDGFEHKADLEFDPGNGSLAGMALTPDGDVVVYDGGDVVLIDEADIRTPLASFPEAPFGSFVILTPKGDSVIFGESTTGGLFEIALQGGGATLVDTLSFNYDMVFDADGRGFVSAPAADFVGNEIFLFDNDPDLETPNPSIVVDIPGFSGPVTIDGDGRLYYGTSNFSAEDGDVSFQKIVRFSKAQVDAAVAGVPVSYDDGEVILSELDGIFDMLFVGNRLFYTDLGFANDEGRVWLLDGDQNFSETTFARMTGAERLVSPSYLAYRPGEEVFDVGVGPAGGTLAVAYSDFATLNRIGFFVPQLFFVRGEVNGDGFVDLSDAISILLFLFLGGSTPDPLSEADIDDTGGVDTTDVILLLGHIFLGGPPPAAPYPEPGADPTP